MEIVVGTRGMLSEETIRAMAAHRHRVFVQTLGWDLPGGVQGLELDQFDRDDTYYAVARHSERVSGVARLLPTVGPYLLEELFPQLMGAVPLPKSPQIWELSRFTALDVTPTDGAPRDVTRQVSSSVAIELLNTVLEFAASHRVRRLITVSPLGIERLLRRSGFLAHRVAPPVRIDGHPTYACWIDVPRGCGGRSASSPIVTRGKELQWDH